VRDLLRRRHFELLGGREVRAADIDPAAVGRFLARLVADPLTGCLLWRGATNGDGYGIFRVSSTPSRLVLAHRLSVALARGICPGDRVVDHGTCDRRCCRDAHLQLVTPEQNTPGIYGLGPRAEDLRADEIPY
jgi:hypothetical protein